MPGLSPLLTDLRSSGARGAGTDALAGTLTAILLIPQALAYALLAGLPPQMGLYASVLPVIVYALLGSSRTLAVGPVAVAAVMVSAALMPYAAGDMDRYVSGAMILSALTGLTLLGFAALRLGWLANLVSHPVLSGFTTGAALFIIGTQIAGLTGIPVQGGHALPEVVQALVRAADGSQPLVMMIGAVSMALLMLGRGPLVTALKRLGIAPGTATVTSRVVPLLVIFGATGLSSLFGWSAQGVAVVGQIPQGLPLPTLRFITEPGWWVLLPSAVMIAIIGYVESISVAKTLAFRRKEKVSPDRELGALGAANLVAAAASTMPVAGGFSRSMVNFDAGARTQLAAIVTALWVAAAAFLFTGLLAELPKAVLSALIVVAVWQLVDVDSLKRNLAYDRMEGAAQIITLLGVLALGIEPGLLLGAGVAILSFLYRTSRPHIAVVGRIADQAHFRNIRRHPVQTFPGLLLMRVDESLYFANAPYLEDALQTHILETPNLRAVLLIMSGVNAVDASGLEVLETLETALRAQGIELHLAEVKGPVTDRLMPTALMQRLGGERLHLSAQDALNCLVGGPQG
jgi:sulfate permease, SulP family